MNPLANTPIFLSLTADKSKASKKRIAKTACITAFIIVTAFVFPGKYIFEAFGITVPAFKITGGILVFYVGFEMLQSKRSKIQRQEDVDTVIQSPFRLWRRRYWPGPARSLQL